MSTPRAEVSRTEGRGFLVTCSGPQCTRFRVLRASRITADWAAGDHMKKAHAQPSPEDEAAVRSAL